MKTTHRFPLILTACAWTFTWAACQAQLLYQNLGYRVVLGQRLDYSTIASSPETVGGLIAYALAFLALHAFFAWANLAAFETLLAPRIALPRTRVIAFLAQLTLVTVALHLSNARHYAQSLAGDLFSLVLIHPSGPITHMALLIAMALYFGAWIVCRLRFSRSWRVVLACAGVVALAGYGAQWLLKNREHADKVGSRPNVVVIGIDSLRPDHLKRSGAPFTVTPHLDTLLGQSAVFTDTLSTQPHTFPAVVSILTGQWPTTSGARGNLFPATLIDTKASIAHAFRGAGYATIIAMDETRFANIDQQYGFDRVVGPRMGLIDFTMSATADNVLVNLVANTRLGRMLFPAIYGNRAIDYVYEPASFSRMVDDALEDARQPIFLYLHFCAAHWPYRTASRYHEEPYADLLRGRFADSDASYLRALSDADAQLGRALATLRDAGKLDNAIVITLSDHGEDFGMAKDAVSNERGEPSTPMVYGHGGSAFRTPQSQVLLSVRRYGGQALVKGSIDAPASLVDIAPTLTELARLPAEPRKFDGISLAKLAEGADPEFPRERIRFVESSFIPLALNKKRIDAGEVFDQAVGMYKFASDGRVQVRPDFIGFQIDYRQRAAYLGQWIVGAREDGKGTILVVDRFAKRWWPLDEAPAAAPSQRLLEAMCEHWRRDRIMDPACHRPSS